MGYENVLYKKKFSQYVLIMCRWFNTWAFNIISAEWISNSQQNIIPGWDFF